MFYTSPEDKYLNVCVWCRVPPKLDKHEKVIKPGRETLIGHVSNGKFSLTILHVLKLHVFLSRLIAFVKENRKIYACHKCVSTFDVTKLMK